MTARGREALDFISVRNASHHNLRMISVDIPRNQITVITGLSGSGKSSLAFDTIYAEGQRRYMDALSTYARQFLEQMERPAVESIEGLSPSIAIDQKTAGLSPRSTVGTVTEIYDYLRLLYARIGVPVCPTHNIALRSRRPDDVVAEISAYPSGSRWVIWSPVVRGKKGEFSKELQRWMSLGYAKARIDGKIVEVSPGMKLAKTIQHDIDLLIDRVIINDSIQSRLAEAVHMALKLSEGWVTIEGANGQPQLTAGLHAACPVCGFSFPELEPRLFSFNNPRGACPTCNGLGTIDMEDDSESDERGSDDEDEVDELTIRPCPDCEGTRLRTEARCVSLGGYSIDQLSELSIDEFAETLRKMKWTGRDALVAERVLPQIQSRLDTLVRVGVPYLSLDRPMRTLSGGEAQRLRLATQLGSSLVGITYVLDEPSIGLHPRDHGRLLQIIREVRDLGNTILMVEHDEETILTADYVIDIGPGAGIEGGQLLFAGTAADLKDCPQSLTGKYLSGEELIRRSAPHRLGIGKFLTLHGASGNNLKNIDVSFPLGKMIAVIGVSGSGKSTLIMDTLLRSLQNHVNGSALQTAPHRGLSGAENIDRVIDINQRPIGRSPRSIPSTYIDLMPLIRELFASLPEAKLRGYDPGRFSFNKKGGRCENCQGGGEVAVEMHFLSNVYVTCQECEGQRFNRETLQIHYKGKSISDVLKMSVREACEFFSVHRLIQRKVETLDRVGLGYITLGQSSTTLSGGEAQRVKLARELSKRSTGRSLYILDEPTTGLHFSDIAKLLSLLGELADTGNTVIIIEHQMDVVAACDHVIDLGPEGGKGGGSLSAVGTPEEVAATLESVSAPYIRQALLRASDKS